nr:hypothetical protein [Neisseria meningitidis]
MLHIPPTEPDRYVSSIVALNVHSPNGTGDWHSAKALSDWAYPEKFYIYGENQERNTNHLLGDNGIIDGTDRLNKMGYFPENIPVWLADHPPCLRGLSLHSSVTNWLNRSCDFR